MGRNFSAFGWCLCLAVTHAFAQATPAPCATPRQHAATEARVMAMTQGFDPQRLGNDYAAADNQRIQALVTVRGCQARASPGVNCQRQLELYTIADQQYRNASQSLDTYNSAASAQARARAAELPVCR